MTLVYTSQKLPPESLTVPPEASRGLRFRQRNWLLYVTDPEPMSVSIFRLSKETVDTATYEILDRLAPGEGKPLAPEDGKALLEWLQAQPFVRVELVEPVTSPSMFPSFPSTGPRPSLGLNPPSIQR